MVHCTLCRWQVWSKPVKLVRKSNGYVVGTWVCDGCGRQFETGCESPESDLTTDHLGKNPACERCGAVESELHHWAPRALFADAEDWPKSWLCPPCHRLWHRTMTP